MRKTTTALIALAVAVLNGHAAAQIGNSENGRFIGLQNMRSRTIVRCYAADEQAMEDCAAAYERKGFVRFRDIPYKTAGYDFLKVDTYPTRRWRDSELTPRW